ncbi:MAG: galactokinase [Chloroflexota bacterium]
MLNSHILQQSFETHFDAKPKWIVRAPGRVNLIGEHTDYNDGYVLPMGIDHAVWIALRPRADGLVRIHSLDLGLDSVFEPARIEKGEGWAEYPKGVAWALRETGYDLRGWEGVMTGDVPRGAGLSSSAAVELAIARAFACASGFDWDAKLMARLAQKAENQWVGVNCGIMDQMASAASRADHALFMDCRTLDIQHAPLPPGTAVVVLDTSTRRGLVDSAYNERRAQCEAGARFFGVKALRDVSVAEFERRKHEIHDEAVLRRARHIITENQRVLDAMEAMRANDVDRLGQLFNASHASLRDDFEVTNEALNQIVEAAQEQSACYGARMTGAGFGGCAVALVRGEQVGAFTQAVGAAYRQRSGLEAALYVCKPSAGASVA